MQPRLSPRDLREELEDRLARARERLKLTEAEVTRLKRFIAGLRDVLATLDLETPPTIEKLPSFEDLARQAEDKPLVTMSIKDAAVTVLRSYGQPMTVRDLLSSMEAAGKHVGGKVPTDTLRAILGSYEAVFQKTPDHKWALANGAPEHESEG